MKQMQLYLCPTPDGQPEFLATIRPVDPCPTNLQIWDDVVQRCCVYNKKNTNNNNNNTTTTTTSMENVMLVFKDYTRESWAWRYDTKNDTSGWTSMVVESIDGRHKLSGWISYLKQRQKSGYGYYDATGIMVVSYVQPPNHKQFPDRMECRICTHWDNKNKNNNITMVSQNNNTQPISKNLMSTSIPTAVPQKATIQPSSIVATTKTAITAPTSVVATSVQRNPLKKKNGFLGKLVGAQQRTNHHVAMAQQQQQQLSSLSSNRILLNQHAAAAAADDDDSGGTNTTTTTIELQQSKQPVSNTTTPAPYSDVATTTTSTTTTTGIENRTVQEVFQEFRQYCQDTMLDFDLSTEQVLKVPIVLKEHCVGLSYTDQLRVTMDVLKYMVYEAAEEVNEEWIAIKENSEYMDEMSIVVYKVGAAPAHVLEDLNQGEIPEEIRGQQRAVQQERAKQIALTELKYTQQLEIQAHNGLDNTKIETMNNMDVDDDDDNNAIEFAPLNKKKRDRRTIEDFEREKRNKYNQT